MYGSMCNVYSSENSATQAVNNDWKEERTETTVICSDEYSFVTADCLWCRRGYSVHTRLHRAAGLFYWSSLDFHQVPVEGNCELTY